MIEKRRPGRPPVPWVLKKVPYNNKLPRWFVWWLQHQENAARAIEELVTTGKRLDREKLINECEMEKGK